MENQNHKDPLDFEALLKHCLNELSLVVLDNNQQALEWIAKNANEEFKQIQDGKMTSALDYLKMRLTSDYAEFKMLHGEVNWEYMFTALSTGTGKIVAFSLVAKARKGGDDLSADLYMLTLDANNLFNVLNVPFHNSGFSAHISDNILNHE